MNALRVWSIDQSASTYWLLRYVAVTVPTPLSVSEPGSRRSGGSSIGVVAAVGASTIVATSSGDTLVGAARPASWLIASDTSLGDFAPGPVLVGVPPLVDRVAMVSSLTTRRAA